ncbi:MAG: response regulator transcription factor [Alphaproteobacteria bacterium]|nr:response regulator transcription factor [Alphaproteobacteria bacterium]
MRVLIVDDHPIVHAGLRRLIALEQEAEIREAATAKEALLCFKAEFPDLIIMDLNLPGIGGLEMIRRLMNEDPKSRILVFSVHEDSIHVARAFEAGALGYVTKSAPAEQISLAIFRVAAGLNYMQPNIAQQLALLSVRTPRRSPPSHPFNELSRRDLEILRLLGKGFSLMQIAETIGLSYKTVANNCTQIKNKLGLARTTDLIRVAIENQFSPPSEAN